MNDDIEEYANSLRRRAEKMEQNALLIRHKQRESSHRELVMTKSFHNELSQLDQGLTQLDADLHRLGLDVKRFIKTFQGLGMRAQFSALQDRVDMIKFGQWISRKEFERISKRIEN